MTTVYIRGGGVAAARNSPDKYFDAHQTHRLFFPLGRLHDVASLQSESIDRTDRWSVFSLSRRYLLVRSAPDKNLLFVQ